MGLKCQDITCDVSSVKRGRMEVKTTDAKGIRNPVYTHTVSETVSCKFT